MTIYCVLLIASMYEIEMSVLLLVIMTVNAACTVVEEVNFDWSGRGCALA